VALDSIKTQVLILHSEQSTLDNLSAGIDDRYTVHCASSGTEALNTLGETPIHVIISEQDLPGMSGVEALREAKKRSPETIGILLAGNNEQGLEALVGEKEVFQVVRGGISGDDLVKLIDDATRQMRLLALAESANDTAANPDEPVSEHIVMETSENGSTIISDGTGALPVLDPKKVSAAQAAGSHAVDILVLTKDQEFLATVKESSRGMHNVRYANTLGQAEQALAKHKIGVAVVDAAMVGEKVEKLTLHLRKRKERLVSIVAGRRDDGEMLMDLINRGKVYRFLLKPVSPGRARLAVEASVKHHIEAPDSAFKVTASAEAAATPVAKPKPKPKSKPAAKPVAKPAAKPAAVTKSKPKPAPKTTPKPTSRPKPTPKPESISATDIVPQPPERPAPKVKPEPVPNPEPLVISADDGLSIPFDGDESSFTQTMTGIVEKVTKKFSTAKDEETVTADADMMPPMSLDVSASAGGSLFKIPKILGIGAVVVIAIVAAGLWMYAGTNDAVNDVVPGDESTVTQSSTTEEDLVVDAPAVPEAAQDLSADELLDEARLARDAGQIFYPSGNNAIELFAAAAALSPENKTIEAELASVLDEAFAMAETAMLERRTEDAVAALARVRLVDADNARLPFLSAQLSQMQLRDHLDDARVAIRANRFQDATNALRAASALNVADTTEIDAVTDELSATRSAQRVDDVLAQAAASLDLGNLISPPNDNASYLYELVLSNDPDNTAALQGLTVIASKLVLQARTQIDGGRFDQAEGLLNEARRLDPTSEEVAAATQAVTDARQRIANDQRRRQEASQAAARAEAERLADLQKAEEQRRAAAAAAVAKPAAEVVADAVAEQTDDIEPEVLAVTDAPVEEALSLSLADESFSDETLANRAPADQFTGNAIVDDVAEPLRPMSAAPIAVSALTRTKYVAPKYPRAAERRNLSGWVDVMFTVAVDGSTKDIEIAESNPGDVFVNAATRAVENWEFEPVIENGELTEKRAAVRMMFAIE